MERLWEKESCLSFWDAFCSRGLCSLPLLQDSTKECNYVASKSSILYHLPTCKKTRRIQKQNGVTFASAEEAVKAGYKPCGAVPATRQGDTSR